MGRRSAGLILAVIALAAVCLTSLVIGTRDLPIATAVDALTDYDGSEAHLIVQHLRVPRTVLGLVAGVALGVSGSLIQAMTRNPLADPGILGVNAGAMFFVALAVGVFGVTSVGGYLWFAFGGALLVTVLVYLLGSAGRGRTDVSTLTLTGVAVAAVLTGITSAITLVRPRAFDDLRNWEIGSLAGRDLDLTLTVLPYLVVGLLVALIVVGPLNAMALGDDLARSLGARVVSTRVLVIVAVTLLAGGATAVAGPIGFVGLIVPHVARWIVGPRQGWILAYTVVLSPLLLLSSDVIGRVVIRPSEMPVGIVTAFVGAPVLIALVRRRQASGL